MTVEKSPQQWLPVRHDGSAGCGSSAQRAHQRVVRTGALTLPWTTACSPKTMTLPGAETMKAGIIGLESLREAFFMCDDLPLV